MINYMNSFPCTLAALQWKATIAAVRNKPFYQWLSIRLSCRFGCSEQVRNKPFVNGFPLGCHVHLVVQSSLAEKEYPNKTHVTKNIYKCKKEYSPFWGASYVGCDHVHHS
jgi:hypothetical protein